MELTSNFHSFEQSLDQHHHNKWCFLIATTHQNNKKTYPLQASIYYQDSQEWEKDQFLLPCWFLPKKYKIAIIYIPNQSTQIRIASLAPSYASEQVTSLHLYPLSRIQAAGLLAGLNPLPILKTLMGSPIHLKKRLRTAISLNYLHNRHHLTYIDWCQFYDQWPPQDEHHLINSPLRHQWPIIHTKLYYPSNYTQKITAHSIQNQWNIDTKPPSSTKYLAIVQNGEIIPPHAYAIFADQAAHHHFPAALYADSDHLNPQGQRQNPCFKPNIGFPALSSGLLTQDIWLFREDIFQSYLKQYPNAAFQSAYTHRLALALFVLQQKLPIHHVPFILSHRTTTPGSETLLDINHLLSDFLKEKHWTGVVHSQSLPIQLTLSDTSHPISLVIPTTIQSKKIQTCLSNLLKHTKYPCFEVILVISQHNPLTPEQVNYLRPLVKKYTQLRVVKLNCKQFNFSQSCNYGIQHAKYNIVGIVNDDIEPITSSWLSYMAGHLQDPSVGAVGAQLYYPNHQIQHAGIIMGAANLCEHAGRFQSANNFPIPYDHDVSAVTGACMLIRRSAYDWVRGFNTDYEIAYNDIEFCLKLGKAEYRIIQCQHAQLIHYESMTLGNHYTGERQGKERQEMISIRNLWHSIHQIDPFYNPNLSLQRGMDYQLAFPPQINHPFITSKLSR